PAPPRDAWPADAERLRRVMPGLSDEVIARAISAWTALFGAVSLEVFGQFANAILDPAEIFDYNMACMGRFIGLPE
ncbi:TetR family transcriptional regulator, partial [Spongiactinospora gelatinilytica]